LASLSSQFGLAPFIGKLAAIISDARLGSRHDQHAIAERLLSISGEDTITVDRKYQSEWTGRLSTRFIVMTNELPRLADASGALASRFIVLNMKHSFYGREDLGLFEKLRGELPGILAWAIQGYERLRRRGYLLQPESAREAIAELEDLGSPVSAFVRDCCTVGTGYASACSDVYEAWKGWCSEQGRDHHGTAGTLGRDLRAAVPGLSVTQPRTDLGRVRMYEGLALK
jgi:putative DNA primase/helicase